MYQNLLTYYQNLFEMATPFNIYYILITSQEITKTTISDALEAKTFGLYSDYRRKVSDVTLCCVLDTPFLSLAQRAKNEYEKFRDGDKHHILKTVLWHLNFNPT